MLGDKLIGISGKTLAGRFTTGRLKIMNCMNLINPLGRNIELTHIDAREQVKLRTLVLPFESSSSGFLSVKT